ncbi:MAG: hypothetical protein M3Y34_05605 [Actinomycetota bacterium]|nr:hypothetical protein [Actinomycetota bacterium]
MDVRALRIALSCCAALLLGLAGAAPAQAAFGMTINDADPASADAGANSNFHLDISFTGQDDVKDLTVHLPPGLVGDPTSTPLCTEAQLSADECPDASKIGTTTTYANLLDLTPLTIPGEVFNVQPRTGEPARLGIVLTPPIGAKVILQSAARLRPGDFGLDTVLEDIPNTADGLPITITRIELTLNGAFMRNPTSCGTKTTTADAASHANTTASGSNSFTSVNCAALPFSPGFEASLGSPGHTDAFTYPPQTTVISQDDGEAGLRRAEVMLPDGIAGDTAYLFANTCTVADFEAHSCADAAIVGQATAESPLQEDALTGPVVLVESGGDLPRLGLDLEGALALQLYGELTINFLPGGTRISVLFEGLPDIPISRFELGLMEDRLNYTGRDLCGPPPLVYDTNFTSHGDVVLDGTAEASVVGCGDEYEEPTGSARLRGATGSNPRLRVRLDAGSAGVDELVVNAPRKARFAEGRIVVEADGQRQPASAVDRAKRSLTVALDAADEVRVKASRGALRLKRSVKAGDRLGFSLDVTDAGGNTFALDTPATARR